MFKVKRKVMCLTLLKVSHLFREHMKMDSVISTAQENIVYKTRISKVSLSGLTSADVDHSSSSGVITLSLSFYYVCSPSLTMSSCFKPIGEHWITLELSCLSLFIIQYPRLTPEYEVEACVSYRHYGGFC